MKIILLSHYFPPEVNAPAKRTFDHAKIFAKEGHEVFIITNFPNHPNGKIYSGYKNKWQFYEEIDGIKVFRILTYATPNEGTIKRSLNFSTYMVLSIICGLKLKNIDVVLATSPQLLCGISGMILSKLKKSLFVFEIRDVWPDSISSLKIISKKSLLFSILKSLENKIIHSSDMVVAVTKGIKKYLENKKHSNVKLITNGINYSNYPNIKKQINNPLTFAYVGTIGMAHNVEIIIDTAKHFIDNKKIKFLIIGDGAKKRLIYKRSKNIHNVEMRPLLQEKDLNNAFNEIDVGLITLEDESIWKDALPSKIFDHLVRAKPVILSIPTGDTSEMIKRYNCGKVSNPRDPNSLISCVNYYFNNTQKIFEHGLNGRELVKNQFDREQIAKELLMQIKSLKKV